MDWCLADPKLGDREVAQATLEDSPPRPGQLIVADKWYAGREFDAAQLATALVDAATTLPEHHVKGVSSSRS